MCQTRPRCSTHVKPCRPAPPQPNRDSQRTEQQLHVLKTRAKALNDEVQHKISHERRLLKQLKVAGANESRRGGSSNGVEVTASVAQLKKDVKLVRHERNLLGQQINAGRKEMSELQASLRDTAAGFKTNIRYHQDMSKSLLEEVGEQKEFIKFHQKRIAAIRKQLEGGNSPTLKAQLSEAEGEVATLRRGLQEIDRDLKSVQSQLRLVTTLRDKARSDLHKMTESRDMWRATAAAALGADIPIGATHKELREALHAKRIAAQKLEEEHKKAAERVKGLGCGNVSAETIDRSLREEVNMARRKNLEEQLAALSYQENLREQLDEAQAENKQLTTFYTTVVEALQHESDELAKDSREAKEMAATTAAMLTAAEQERDYWRARAVEGEEAAAAVAASMQDEINRLTTENQALRAELLETEQELVAVKEESEAAKKELEDMKATIVAVVVVGLAVAGVIALLLDRNGNAVTLPTYDPNQVKVVVENERWYPFPFSTWSKKLLPTDRYNYTRIDGTTQADAPETMPLAADEVWVEGAWRVEGLGSPDGWLYSVDFPSTYYTENFSMACVRRRIHVRGFMKNGSPLPPPPSAGPPSELLAGSRLLPGEEMVSPSGRFRCIVQTDGNFVLYDVSKAIWSSNTCRKPVAELVFQTDGNVVLYAPNNVCTWSTNTYGRKSTRFVMQDDGNLVLYGVGGKPQWSVR